MKQYLLLLFLSFTFLSGLSVRREGTLEVKGWAPFRGMKSAPQIESITLKWAMDDNDGTGTPVRITAVKWKIGEFYMLDGQKYPVASLGDVADKLSITQLSLKSHLCFKGGQSDYTTFVEMAGFVPKSGSDFGAEKRDFIDWKTLFTDIEADSAKKIFAKNFILCNLQVAGIEFGGTQFVEQKILYAAKETEFNAKIAEGDLAMKQENYSQAESLYQQALQIIPNHVTGLEKLNRARFFMKIKDGDIAFNQGEYARSKQIYMEAAQMLPNDQSAQSVVQNKIKDTEFQLAKTEYNGLLQRGDAAVKQGDYNTAKGYYDQAARIFPNDVAAQNEIQIRIQNIAAMVAQAQFNQYMGLGDAELRNKNYNAAKGYYQQALSVFPGHPQASAAMAECDRQMELIRKYENTARNLMEEYIKQGKAASAEAQSALSKAAASFDFTAEGCNMEYAKYYNCMADYLQQKKDAAFEEAKWIVYGDASGKPRLDLPDLCIKPGCNPVDNTDAAQKSPSQAWLDVAKRKYNFAKNNTSSADLFLASAKTFTQTAVQKDNQNINALAFSALFGQDLVESMTAIQKALYLSPSNQEALALKGEFESKFAQELQSKMDKGETGYIKRAVDARLLNGISLNGISPAQYAVEKNQGDILSVILGGVVTETGAQNIQNLLFRAVEKNSKNCVGILMQYGAKPDVSNDRGETPLTIASRKGYKEIVEALSEQSFDKGNALMIAVMENQLETARSLLAKGANPEVKDKNGDNLLMNAIRKKNESMAELLISKGANVNHQNFREETPLSYAVNQGMTNLVNRLLSENASPADALEVLQRQSEKETESLAVTTAMYAIEKNRPEFTPLIVKYYPKVAFALNDRNEAVIFYALTKNAFEIGKQLLGNIQIDLNQPVNGKFLLLEMVSQNRKEWIAEMLKRSDINVNVKSAGSENALHLAARNGLAEIASMLIAQSCDKELKDSQGNTPLMVAVEAGKESVATLLLKSGVSLNNRNNKNLQALHLAVINRDMNMAESLLNAGAGVNVAGDSGLTPLHYAAQMGNTDMARLLLSKGADKKMIDNFKRTPSKLAAKYKHKALAKMLK